MQLDYNKLMPIKVKDFNELPQNNPFVESAKQFVELQQLYSAAIKEIYTKLEILDQEFEVKYDYNPIHHIEYRLKSVKSIAGKIEKKHLTYSVDSIRNNIYDVAGIRVICNYIDDIYKIADCLTGQDDVKLVRVKDYIKNPKINGYRSLHLIVSIPVFLSDSTEHMNVEVQIRTIAMDFWATLEHELKYKTKNEVSDELKSRLHMCAESITELDQEMQSIRHEINKK